MKKEKSDQNAVSELTREWLYKENKWLWEENKKLKSDLAFERTMLDNVRAEYENLQDVNKKLKEERIFSLGEYDYMILTSTTPQLKIIKKNQNYSLMEEDTLQELRDIGEI